MPRLDNLEISNETMESVGAIVLGGGRGTRLYPLTKVRAKPAVPLAGRYRLVDIPLSNCIHSGIKNIFVLTQFNSHSLNRHINNTYRFDNFTRGMVEVLSAEQTDASDGMDWFQGTADAVRKQWAHICDFRATHYIILSGDQLYRMNYRDLMATHLKKNADVTVAALPVSRGAAKSFGVMKVQNNARIREFVEKPTDAKILDELVTPQKVFQDFGLNSRGKPYLASMGVYAFRASVLEELLMNNRVWIDFGRELIPNSLATKRVFSHMFSGYWEDIGTVRSYFDASMEMTSPKPPFEFHDPKHLFFTHARALPGVVVEDVRMTNCIICGGSRIGKGTITNSILGIRSMVKSGVELNRCIVLGAEYYDDQGPRSRKIPIGIGENTKIENAIIDHNARIGKNVVIRGNDKLPDFESAQYVVRDGIIVVFKNAVIPDGTVIG